MALFDDESAVDLGPVTGHSGAPGWPAPVRDPSDVVHSMVGDGGLGEDPLDASEEWADITEVGYGTTNAGSWGIALAAAPPRFDELDSEVVVSYGLVLDTNADGTPDYLAGISSDAPRPGDVRAWLTDLSTGEIDERVGPPYGVPIEFAYPTGQGLVLTFLSAALVPGLDPETVRFYVWTFATRDGVVFADDYAPDTGWYAPGVAGPARPTVAKPELPDPGEQPADEAAAEEQVRLAFTGIFDSASTREARARFSERPAVWSAANQQLDDGEYAEFVDGMFATVDEVVFSDPTHAAVRFQLTGTNGAIPQAVDIGEAVLVDRRWLVAIDTTCALVEPANVHCDMSL
ncbi:MAG: hypothetical protein ACJ739_11280 [Acidimicrobiales bacterium]